MSKFARRVVTGHDEHGKSIVVSDGTPPQHHAMHGPQGAFEILRLELDRALGQLGVPDIADVGLDMLADAPAQASPPARAAPAKDAGKPSPTKAAPRRRKAKSASDGL
jgi:hypothetical protein